MDDHGGRLRGKSPNNEKLTNILVNVHLDGMHMWYNTSNWGCFLVFMHMCMPSRWKVTRAFLNFSILLYGFPLTLTLWPCLYPQAPIDDTNMNQVSKTWFEKISEISQARVACAHLSDCSEASKSDVGNEEGNAQLHFLREGSKKMPNLLQWLKKQVLGTVKV